MTENRTDLPPTKEKQEKGSELQNWCAECEQTGLRCARPAPNQHAQDEELRPQDRPATCCGGSAARV